MAISEDIKATAADLQPHVDRLRTRIGTIGPGVSRRIEVGALVKFAHATGQTDPLYIDEAAAAKGPFGAIIAAPTYVSTFCAETMAGLLTFDLPLSMFLHTDDAVDLGVPIRAGDVISGEARYAEAYLREGRAGPLLFQIAEMTLSNQDGARVATVRVGSVSFDP
ncbi:FAS1-like dehydratase domain-containing protein [Sphingomonas immobilis]|uniref:MaoC family dehydratase N-terminal domain-containing protein n=1 Tax=Sphingomonas immobilis TaxID=3063997 RepID=A0ABT8ZXL1_9SPHN|nr:MaoC family dehydratase N-terminal domain-containing protein [Sphingomonas sp. CA1-15]MDO7842289.1 MaoC family dehydratase N-terminal domain-containing protein [Sphingomonas sp. CA1-15]